MADECVNRLALILDGRMKTLDERPPLLDFGEIKGNTLLTDSFPVPISKNDCVICGEELAWESGRRVLVAWVGDTAVVVSAIKEGT